MQTLDNEWISVSLRDPLLYIDSSSKQIGHTKSVYFNSYVIYRKASIRHPSACIIPDLFNSFMTEAVIISKPVH